MLIKELTKMNEAAKKQHPQPDYKKIYHDKDEWMADAKKFGFSTDYWGHGSVDAYDDGQRVGTWRSDFDSNNDDRAEGWFKPPKKKTSESVVAESAMSGILQKLNVTKLDVKDLSVAGDNGGYTDEFEEYVQCVYGKYDEKYKHHVYYVVWEDANEEGPNNFHINEFFLSLGKTGYIEGEFGPMPIHGEMTKDEAVKKLASMKAK